MLFGSCHQGVPLDDTAQVVLNLFDDMVVVSILDLNAMQLLLAWDLGMRQHTKQGLLLLHVIL